MPSQNRLRVCSARLWTQKFLGILRSPLSTAKSRKFAKRKSAQRELSFQHLEPRQLLAILFDSGKGQIVFGGSNSNDVASVSVTGSTVNAKLNGFADRSFSLGEVDSIIFTGLGGDDTFENKSSIPSFAYGNNGRDTLTGGSADDVLVGGADSDVLVGNDGDDLLRGGIGDNTTDEIDGGKGADRIFGGLDINNITGGSGDDLIFGGPGVDTIRGGEGNDQIFPGHGENVVYGGNGNDLVISGKDADMLFGEAGDDRLDSKGGADQLFGGSGDDQLIAGTGNDSIDAGNGIDLVRGGDGDDSILGIGSSGGRNRLYGDGGADTISGGSHVDLIIGGNGNDILNGNSGDDAILGDNGDDTIDAGLGNDTVFGGNGNDSIDGSSGKDRLVGGVGSDELFGGNDNDKLLGGDGDDRLFGENGNDTLNGGVGLDGLFGGFGKNTLIGGGGFDRFLTFYRSDTTFVDQLAAESEIIFRNNTSNWTHDEVAIIDEGLQKLHLRTRATYVFQDSLDKSPLTFFKMATSGNSSEAGANRLQNEYTFTADGNIVSEVFTRGIEIRDWDTNNASANEFRIRTTIHEIAHSWDSTREISERFAGQGSIWTSFLAQSGWKNTSGSGFTKSSSQTTEPFDLKFNSTTKKFEQLTRTWYYRSSTTFPRDYGSTSPKEDWSVIWEIALSDDAEAKEEFRAKVNVVNRLFDLL